MTDTAKHEFYISTPAGTHDGLQLASLSFSGASILTIHSLGGGAPGGYVLVTAPGGITGALPAMLNLPSGWVGAGTSENGGTQLVLNLSSADGSAWDAWKSANAPGSNPHDDTDGDGVTNAVEFVLGGTHATNDLDKLPLLLRQHTAILPDEGNEQVSMAVGHVHNVTDPRADLPPATGIRQLYSRALPCGFDYEIQ